MKEDLEGGRDCWYNLADSLGSARFNADSVHLSAGCGIWRSVKF